MFGLMPFALDNSLSSAYNSFIRDMNAWSENGILSGFRTDVREDADRFLLEAELPGFKKEDIAVSLEDGMLTIRAERKEETENEQAQGGYIRRERRYGSFARSFNVDGIDEAGITAAYDNGILTLTLPKLHPQEKASRTIDIL